jgi:hypothetical protein
MGCPFVCSATIRASSRCCPRRGAETRSRRGDPNPRLRVRPREGIWQGARRSPTRPASALLPRNTGRCSPGQPAVPRERREAAGARVVESTSLRVASRLARVRCSAGSRAPDARDRGRPPASTRCPPGGRSAIRLRRARGCRARGRASWTICRWRRELHRDRATRQSRPPRHGPAERPLRAARRVSRGAHRHGAGCPVCVIDRPEIDEAIALSRLHADGVVGSHKWPHRRKLGAERPRHTDGHERGAAQR